MTFRQRCVTSRSDFADRKLVAQLPNILTSLDGIHQPDGYLLSSHHLSMPNVGPFRGSRNAKSESGRVRRTSSTKTSHPHKGEMRPDPRLAATEGLPCGPAPLRSPALTCLGSPAAIPNTLAKAGGATTAYCQHRLLLGLACNGLQTHCTHLQVPEDAICLCNAAPPTPCLY